MNMNKRIDWLDILRITSIICMMILHSAASSWYSEPVASVNWHILNLYDGLVRFCVPIFIMISGALFLDPAKEVPAAALYRKYIPRILYAYLFWSVCYTVIPKFVLSPAPYDNLGKEILWGVIGSHHHLWFCCAITGLYIITPLLRCITADRKMTEYFLAASFVFAILIPTLQEFYPFSYTSLITDRASLFFLCGYPFYFVLGHYLYQKDLSQKAVLIICLCGIPASFVTIAGTAFLSLRQHLPTEVLYGYLTPNCAMQAASVFVFFKYIVSRAVLNEKQKRLITRLSALSFGMYLVHDLFNMLLIYSGFSVTAFSPVIAVPVMTAVVFICSLVSVCILNQIPFLRKCL